jgi:dTDP-glucose pyrophosphorylase/predicted transcriptional regulator
VDDRRTPRFRGDGRIVCADVSVGNWEASLIQPTDPILTAIGTLNKTAAQICLVVDANRRLLGTVTDGDIRRGILASVALDQQISRVMNQRPLLTALPDTPAHALREKMRALCLRQAPILDVEGRVTGLVTLEDVVDLGIQRKANWVLVMAGGLGSRLHPLTKDVPKPLLKVGGRPILETILDTLVSQGFVRFFFSLNYRGEMIEEYFGDGSRWGVEITYLRETAPMGTAGPLGLLPETPRHPLVVVNGDLLTQTNFANLIDHHTGRGSSATMCVRKYEMEVPFGVVKLSDDDIRSIDEKPVHAFFVNAGIYVLEAATLRLVPQGEPLDMPELFRRAVEAGLHVRAFPIHEYWLDVGRPDDFERANQDFKAAGFDPKP